jgi:hypothetical protein
MQRDYEILTKAFNSEKVNIRYDYLFKKADGFIRNRDIEKYVAINRRRLKELIIDYFGDARRIKEFLYLNEHVPKSVSSYLAYWIIKKQPLKLSDKTDYKAVLNKPFLKYVNEWFAFHIILNNAFHREDYNLFYDL